MRSLRHGLLRLIERSSLLGLSAFLMVQGLCVLPAFADRLQAGFVKPPPEARPWVYWFWLNGNITSNGITADLEAMKRVGIGGVLIMEVDQGAPVGPVDFMSPKWRGLFQHVHREARRLGLEVNANNDAGWNGSGGPWIRPEQAMQKVVWSETNLSGPSRFEGALAQPEIVAGFYRDISALAFPTPGAYRIANIKAKALYEVQHVGEVPPTNLPPEQIVERRAIVELTPRLDRAGRLSWDVPTGQWTVVRFGHTCTGMENAPAPKSGRGLECDKLSKTGIEANFKGMMLKLAGDNKIQPGKAKPGLVATHIDSWENGAQNWSETFREEFQRRRGYELLQFLPVFTGRVVESAEVSERFLWDLRRTISELVVENYAGRMRELAHAHGLRFTVEAYGGPCDNIPYGGQSDEPMGEFWSPSGAMETCRGMASAAHVYGKPIVGAEAFTAADQEKWLQHPAILKALGDQAFCEGINRFVFHRYALQPWTENLRPGMTMGPWGQHYERTQTWWEMSPAWHEYLARCQFMLRQGLFVADICYLQAEAPPQGFAGHPLHGYNWDECSPEVVLTRMSVRDGRIVLPDSMSYRLLVLPGASAMTPPLLRKISELVQAGATVIGTPPKKSPSLTDFPQCDQEVQALAQVLWADCDGIRVKEHAFGQGRFVWSAEPETVLLASGVRPDFTASEELRCIHRKTGDTEIYFVANPSERDLSASASFRVSGKRPELWWPETGRIELAPVWQPTNGLTRVMLPLGPSGSVFVVFRKDKAGDIPVLIVSRDGKPCLSALETHVPVVVERARYGVLDDPARTRDVREKVQARIDAGESSFAVRLMAEGDDPAPGALKTLAVDYVIGGKHFSVKGQDPATIHLTAQALSVTVESARYGVLDDPKRTRDVRQKLQALFDAGESKFVVARMAEGDDPAFLVVKTLIAECQVDGKRMTLKGTDPELIDLRPKLLQPFARPLELHQATTKGLQAEVCQPGHYEVTSLRGARAEFSVAATPPALEITGPWKVEFTPGMGAPAETVLDRLISWSEHAEPGIKYFSGVATYTKTVHIPREMLANNRRLYLDLGKVAVIAEVRWNGKAPIILWKPPFRADVTRNAKVGDNQLEVRVVNLWPNRMIGDEQLPEDSDRNPDGTLKRWPPWLQEGKPSPTGRYTFTTWRLWKKNDALLESGLLGPVRLQTAELRSLRLPQ